MPDLSPAHLGAVAQQVDGRFAAFAESVELVLVAVYEAILPLLSDELVPMAEICLGHHRQHAQAMAELAGEAATGEPDPVLLEALTPQIAELSGSGSALRFAKDLEERMGATYVSALGRLEQPEAVTLAATIAPVEASHAVTLADLVDGTTEDLFPTGAFAPTDPLLGFDPASTATS
ncbi:MAG: ferritin-like domain-containing protein [Acidimicrobiia bacterium]